MSASYVTNPLFKAASTTAAPLTATICDAAKLSAAARLIHNADVLLIGSGAGLGAASGFGTFRGVNAGIWPPLVKHNLPFQALSTPSWFHKAENTLNVLDDVRFAYAFWLFRYQAYTGVEPHEGYHLMRKWIEEKGAKKMPKALEKIQEKYWKAASAAATAAQASSSSTSSSASAVSAASSSSTSSTTSPPASNPHLCGFFFTSNIDGHGLRCGLHPDQVIEIHGSINFSQCADVPVPKDVSGMSEQEAKAALQVKAHSEKHRKCGYDVWPTKSEEWNSMQVDPVSSRILPSSPLPRCIHCSSISRPNVLMFGDMEWHDTRYEQQEKSYDQWYAALKNDPNIKICVIEIGAGTAIPSVREQSRKVLRAFGPERSSLIRLNLEASHITKNVGGGGKEDLENKAAKGRLLSFTQPSLDVLRWIDVELQKLKKEEGQEGEQKDEQANA